SSPPPRSKRHSAPRSALSAPTQRGPTHPAPLRRPTVAQTGRRPSDRRENAPVARSRGRSQRIRRWLSERCNLAAASGPRIRVGRRIIICDGAEAARLWSRIGADLSEELTWVPREGESRSRPPGFRILQGGLDEGAIAKLGTTREEEYALVSDDGPWTRLAVREIRKVDEEASILVLSDALTQEDLPDHDSLRRTGWKTLIRDDINEEFDHLANLHRVVKIRRLLDQREKIAILLQPDPDPDGIASAYALRTLLGRKRTTAPIVSFGEVQ